MKKLIIIVVIIIAAILAAIQPIGMASTVSGLRHAVHDDPGTWLYQSESLIVATWTYGEKYAFAVLSKSGQVVNDLCAMRGAQACDWRSITEFTTWLESNGFKRALAADLPPAIVASLSSYRMFLVSLAQASLPSVMIVPVGAIRFIPTGEAQ